MLETLSGICLASVLSLYANNYKNVLGCNSVSELSEVRSASPEDYTDDYTVRQQNYAPKSPSAASLAMKTDYPVSCYTGVPEISVPLYTIECDGVSIPLTLSYHASGFRPSQEATWVGLGWSLTPGGSITRTVKCSDDFNEFPSYTKMSEGYLDAPNIPPASADYFLWIYKYAAYVESITLKKDSEPDIFFYSVPGASGKFVFNKSREAVMLEKTPNVRIQLVEDPHSTYFVITLPDGTSYRFTLCEKTRNYSRDGFLNKNDPSSSIQDEGEAAIHDYYQDVDFYTSSWLLSDIITPHRRNIHFSYTPECYQLPATESATFYNPYHFIGLPTSDVGGMHYSRHKSVVNGYRLSQIVWDGGRVDFSTSQRQDMLMYENGPAPEKLDSIKVFSHDGNLVKSFALTYGYYNDSYTGSYPQVFKRLKLLSVHDQLTPGYIYTFTYNEGQMPPKNSNDTDYWGYYNGRRQYEIYYPAGITSDGTVYNGGDKRVSLAATQLGVLSSIQYPTGGTTSFEYESNTYTGPSQNYTYTCDTTLSLSVYKKVFEDDYPLLSSADSCVFSFGNQTSVSFIGYADRISSDSITGIDVGSDDDAPYKVYRLKANGERELVFRFLFPQELVSGGCSADFFGEMVLPKGNYLFVAESKADDLWLSFSAFFQTTVQEESGGIRSAGGLRVKRISGSSVLDYSYSGGILMTEPVFLYAFSDAAYVDEYGAGDVIYNVQTSASTVPMSTLRHGNIVGYSCVREQRADGSYVERLFHNQREERVSDEALAPPTIDFYNGLPISESVYDRHGNLFSKTSYEYEDHYGPTVNAFIYKRNERTAHWYSYEMDWPMRSAVSKTYYEDNGVLHNRTEFTYDSLFQIRTEKVTSGGECYEHERHYATERQDSVSRQMVERYMVGVPLERLLVKDSQVVRGVRTEYGCWNDSLLVPVRQDMLETTSPLSYGSQSPAFREALSVHSYDNYGNPLHTTYRTADKVLLWSYRGQYLVAVIDNATLQEVSSRLGESFVTQLSMKDAPTESDYAAIRGLLQQLPGIQLATYTWIPLVGLSSETDTRGKTVYYDYDDDGRLKEKYLMENGAKSLLQRHDYHYREPQLP